MLLGVVLCIPGWIILAMITLPIVFWPFAICAVADIGTALLNHLRSTGETHTAKVGLWYFRLLFSVPGALVGYGIVLLVGGFIGIIALSLMSFAHH